MSSVPLTVCEGYDSSTSLLCHVCNGCLLGRCAAPCVCASTPFQLGCPKLHCRSPCAKDMAAAEMICRYLKTCSVRGSKRSASAWMLDRDSSPSTACMHTEQHILCVICDS